MTNIINLPLKPPSPKIRFGKTSDGIPVLKIGDRLLIEASPRLTEFSFAVEKRVHKGMILELSRSDKINGLYQVFRTSDELGDFIDHLTEAWNVMVESEECT